MERHWLTRPETIRKLWALFIAVLAAVVLAELLVPREAHFDVERLFGFYALFGFVACAVLIVAGQGHRRLSQASRHLLRRRGGRCLICIPVSC